MAIDGLLPWACLETEGPADIGLVVPEGRNGMIAHTDWETGRIAGR